MEQFHTTYYKSQIGILKIICSGKSIASLSIVNENDLNFKFNNYEGNCKLCNEAITQLEQYFNRTLKQFKLPLFYNGTKFQNAVWNYLSSIPYGKTVTYSQVAESINCKCVRSVGTAIGKNPIPIIIPCHRVIRKDGTIGEYSMGGSLIKRYLLNIEANN